LVHIAGLAYCPNITGAYIELRMTQTANRAPQQGATVPQGACTPGGAAGTGAPASTKIIPLPVYRGDVCGSLLGTMLFPNDPARADTCAAQLLRGPLQEYLRAGYKFSLTQVITFLDALGREISSKEIETQKLHGNRAGEVVKILWALICSRPDVASWDSAIWVVEDTWTGEGRRAGRATFRADLSEMRAVLHLWGALALRDYQLLADPNAGYDGLDDLAALMSEAMALRQQLCLWRDGRNKPDTLLAGDAFGPWTGWQPHEPRPGWPDTGRIYAISLPPDVRVPVPRPSGRPPKRGKSVR
jgi:hypothetical protein